MYTYNDYIEGVSSGEILSCEYVKLSVQRHLNDLKKSKKKDYRYYFDEAEAQRVIRFIMMLRHTAGEYANQKFKLQPFQQFIIAVIFGWRDKEKKTRRFIKAYVEIPRKNGKSELAAAIALYMLIADNEYGAQVVTAATKRDQAKIVLDAAKNMAAKLKADSKRVDSLVGIHRYNIHVLSTNSRMEALTAESDKLDGLNPSCAIIDEYGAHKSDDLVKVIETGMVARRQGLLFFITTAYPFITYPCYAFRKVGIDILRGIKEDETTFFIIYTIDENDDWNDKNVWAKANANIGVTPEWDKIEKAYTTAITYGTTAESHFKNKNLNVWTTVGNVWIPLKKWRKAGKPYDISQLKGRPCYSGLDLSKNIDLTAWVLLFPPTAEDPIYYVVPYFFCPQDTIAERSKIDRVPYMQWERDGYILPTPGNVIDKEFILEHMIKVRDLYDFKLMGYDKRYSYDIIPKIEAAGYITNPFSQGPNDFTSPITELENLIKNGKLNHMNNPVLEWMSTNVTLRQFANGGVMFDKDKSIEKIDGMVALAMALGEYLTDEPEAPSVYSTRGIITIGG